MTTSDPVASSTADDLVLWLASSAYLARFTGSSRAHRVRPSPLLAIDGVSPDGRGHRLYQTCVIDPVLEHSPAEYVRQPVVVNESPTLGSAHLQFEALLTAARDSDNPFETPAIRADGFDEVCGYHYRTPG